MTGEVTLRGRVLEIGGLKRKAIAGYYVRLEADYNSGEKIKKLGKMPDELRKI